MRTIRRQLFGDPSGGFGRELLWSTHRGERGSAATPANVAYIALADRAQSCKFQTKLKMSPFFVSSAIAKSNSNS